MTENQTKPNQKPARQLHFPPPIFKAAKRIAAQLNETQKAPFNQIARIIELCGLEFAEQILAQTEEIEAQGGILIPTGERRRTRGGVFFHLAKEQMTEATRTKVFIPFTERKAANRFKWSERVASVQATQAEPGTVTSIDLSLTGRPVNVTEYLDGATVILSDITKTLPTPKGVPQIPRPLPEPTVHLNFSQWSKIKREIDNPGTVLTVEGVCSYDPETGSVTIVASKVSSGGNRPKQGR